MNREDDPHLWDLLGHSNVPSPSPFFARNVLRAIRAEADAELRLFGWLPIRRLWPSLSAIAAILMTATALQTLHNHRAPSRADMFASADSDSETAADLDVLTSDDDPDDASLLL